jgi:hypothetical protein
MCVYVVVFLVVIPWFKVSSNHSMNKGDKVVNRKKGCCLVQTKVENSKVLAKRHISLLPKCDTLWISSMGQEGVIQSKVLCMVNFVPNTFGSSGFKVWIPMVNI